MLLFERGLLLVSNSRTLWSFFLQGQSQVATRPMGQEESTPSAALAQELATMQDIAEGLQHSQHFNNTSQALKRDIAAMCESLSAFNAGAISHCSKHTLWILSTDFCRVELAPCVERQLKGLTGHRQAACRCSRSSGWWEGD